jgi:hypothetical protein
MSTLESSEAVFDIPTLITVEQLARIVQKSFAAYGECEARARCRLP